MLVNMFTNRSAKTLAMGLVSLLVFNLPPFRKMYQKFAWLFTFCD